tara:strand:- start:86 stop:970 length:885 start_codon:yes stop_codon:yes gene_type:complete
MNIKELSGYSLDENTTCIQVSGQDSETFLQGQFSNDITHVTESTYQYSSYSTNQGKVISIFRIIREKQSYLLLVNKNIAEYFIERLSMYILMSKVNINRLENYKVYGVCGKAAEKLLSNNHIKENGYLQNEKNHIINNNNKHLPAVMIIQRDVNNEIKDLIAEYEELSFNVNELIDNLLLLPRISMITKETYIPQVLNLEDLNGINYKKGCYTGQEIVARTHYLGKIKKKVFLMTHDNPSVKVGDKIHNNDGEIVGEIFTSVQNVQGILMCIGVLMLTARDNIIFTNNTKLNLY